MDALHFHHQGHVILFILSREKRVTNVQLVEDAAKAPHVNGMVVGDAKYNLWSPIESRLNIGINLLILKAATSEVDYFDSGLVDFPKQNVLWLEVTVDNVVLIQVVQRYQYLDCESLDQVE